MQAQGNNPYAPPAAAVEDVAVGRSDNGFIPNGRVLPASRGSAWIGMGWRQFSSAPLVWVGMCVVFLLIWIVISLIPIVNIISSLAMPMFVAGFMITAENQYQRGVVDFNDLFAGFKHHMSPLIVLGALSLVLTFVCMIPFVIGAVVIGIFAATLHLSIAAIVTLGVFGVAVVVLLSFSLYAAIWFAPALVVLQNIRPVEAMKMSFIACMRNWASYTIFGLLSILLMLLAMLPFLLGMFIFMPVMYLAMYFSYRDIFIQEAW